MSYQIKVDYTTGDSFNSYDTSNVIELKWESLEMAKRNLKNIQEHYELYRSKNTYFRRKELDIKDYIDREWFVSKLEPWVKCTDGSLTRVPKETADTIMLPDEYYATHCIKLITDKETTMQIHCFWCGYFEHLISAEIVSENLDTKFYA